MSIVDVLSGSERQGGADGVDDVVELVTLKPGQVMEGLGNGNAHPFPDIASALRFARDCLSAEERSLSWIRTGSAIIKLADAETGQLAANSGLEDSKDTSSAAKPLAPRLRE